MLKINIPKCFVNGECIDSNITIIKHDIVSNVGEVNLVVDSIIDSFIYDGTPSFSCKLTSQKADFDYEYCSSSKNETLIVDDGNEIKSEYVKGGKVYLKDDDNKDIIKTIAKFREEANNDYGRFLISRMDSVKAFFVAKNFEAEYREFNKILDIKEIQTIKPSEWESYLETHYVKNNGVIVSETEYPNCEIYALTSLRRIQSLRFSFHKDFGNELTPKVQEYIIKFIHNRYLQHNSQVIITTIHQHVIDMFEKLSVPHKVLQCK